MYYTVIGENPALKSANAKQAVAKGYAAARKGHPVQIYQDNEIGSKDLSELAMKILEKRMQGATQKPAAEIKNVDLHNALEELAMIAHQLAPIVLKRDLEESELEELTRLGDQVNNFLYN